MTIKLKENTFFTSDTHFCHDKDFLYKPRGYSSIKEHDENIVIKWNNTVQKNDTVIHLGDFCLTDVQKSIEYIRELNGNIFWLRGNHDTDAKVDYILNNCNNVMVFDNDEYVQIFQYNKCHIYCSHYPTLTSNFDDGYFNSHLINLHGHTHQKENWLNINNPFMYHVGLDSHNCTPVNIEEIIVDIRNTWTEMAHLNITPHGIYNNY